MFVLPFGRSIWLHVLTSHTDSGDSFFDQFNFFSGNDPTHGFVRYANAEVARSQNLVEKSTSTLPNLLSADGTIILRVDTSEQNATFGRRSVRISSKETYSSGLFIFDVIHSPYGCATWPALWISDLVSWPSGGEIDVMESVNVGDTGNHMALHTTKGCKVGKSRRRKQSGKALTYNCYNGTNANSGCGVGGPDYSYGQAFNEIGGGVYAVEVRSEGIRVWFFDRASIPMDIIAHAPDPSTWDTALADFPNLECNINKHFRDMAIVANIDLCGDWAGHPSVFGSNPMCKGTCSNYVAFIPDAFKEAYWEFSGFWVYEKI